MALVAVKKLSEVGNRVRKTYEIKTLLLAPNASETFVIDCGASAIVQRLKVDSPCVVEVYGVADKNPVDDPTPYKFVATADHLIDDGSTALRDGTIIKTRQYSIFVNLENPKQPQVYGVITNNQSTSASITLTLTYLTVEDI
jgi:hypothetical protein